MAMAGSARRVPNTRMHAPATIAPTEPAASAARCSQAPRMLRFRPACRPRSSALPRLTASPADATTSKPSPETFTGFTRRLAAATTIQIETPRRRYALVCAANVSTRCSP